MWVLAVVLAVHLVQFVNNGFDRPAHGFVSHYTASRLVVSGVGVAQFYDDNWFKARVSEHEPTVIDLYGANLPTMSLLMLPLTVFDYHQARVVWTVGSVVLLMATLAALMWQLKLTANWTAAFACYVLLYQPLYEHLFHGQMYILALALRMPGTPLKAAALQNLQSTPPWPATQAVADAAFRARRAASAGLGSL